jgi:hypothetical protein
MGWYDSGVAHICWYTLDVVDEEGVFAGREEVSSRPTPSYGNIQVTIYQLQPLADQKRNPAYISQ